jgi:enoyl-CoA hydratase
MSEISPIAVIREGAVGIVELARPEKFNCLSTPVFEAVDAAIDSFAETASGVRCVLVRAQGKHFCTGADLEEVLPLREDIAKLSRFISLAHRVLSRLGSMDLPVVAACQGLSLAGGLELMLACDVAFAAKDARFGDQHAQFGLLPGFGGSQRLPRIVGMRRALDLFFSARWIDADTALQWGLVNYVVEPGELHGEALAYCQTIATRSRVGLATMKRFARDGIDMPLADGLRMEENAVPAGLLEADAGEGLAAFMARRAPQFKS